MGGLVIDKLQKFIGATIVRTGEVIGAVKQKPG